MLEQAAREAVNVVVQKGRCGVVDCVTESIHVGVRVWFGIYYVVRGWLMISCVGLLTNTKCSSFLCGTKWAT